MKASEQINDGTSTPAAERQVCCIYQFSNKRWKRHRVRNDWCKTVIVHLYKRKGSRQTCAEKIATRHEDSCEPRTYGVVCFEIMPVDSGPSTSQVSKETFSDETSRQLDETFGDETIENIGMETSSPSPSPAIPIAKSRSTSAKAPSLPCT
ncbi:hypothetical protein EVAR_77126_1 [Eumeta japonica]|uniref:Uncharacterized protein n=1 Tax=Eumeta variegata TaxID=151549 RepID=A0A4C1T2Q9_EUMVA|nr:hypothetical protein EVAR_77126_1 [Eumeta japonica]